jgi:hypothetical protein
MTLIVCWIHAVRRVRLAPCRTTDKFGSPKQQQEVKKMLMKNSKFRNPILR